MAVGESLSMKSNGLNVCGACETNLNGSSTTIWWPNASRLCSAVSRKFSPLKSTTTAESSDARRNGMTHETPLPTPVGAKTAVCTAFGIRTNAGCNFALRRSRIDARNCSHASFDDTQELKSSWSAVRNGGFPPPMTRPMMRPELASSIPAAQVVRIGPACRSEGRQSSVTTFGIEREQRNGDRDVADAAQLQCKYQQAPDTGRYA